MKRIASIFMVIVMLVSICSTTIFAAGDEMTFKYELSVDEVGQSEKTVNKGDVITIILHLNRTDDNSDYTMYSMQDEIRYDTKFFELVPNSEVLANGVMSTDIAVKNDNREFYMNFFSLGGQSWEANKKIGSFQLRVIAETGSTEITNQDYLVSLKDGSRSYDCEANKLKIKIGDTSVTPKNYTLTFNTDGGNNISSVTKEEGTKVDLTKYNPTKTGYKFDGWYLDAELKNKASDEITLNKDTTVYAKWKEIEQTTKYTLTFETNGGSSISAITVNDGDVVNLSSKTPTKSGYTFVGWYTDTALTYKVTSITLDSNKTVYAKWSKNSTVGGSGSVTKYTISFETNGGSEVDSTSKVRNTTVDLSKYITHKEGYSFDGWHTDKELTNKVTSIKVTENTTLYAKWVEGDNGYVDNPNYKPDIFAPEHNAYIVGRDGGYIAPNENLTRAEAATIFFRLIDAQVRTEGMTRENAFADVNEGDWFNTAVSTLANLEVLKGRTTDSFAPNETITRAEFMTIVARLSEATYDGEDIFSDTDGHWAEYYINIAASIKWANGDNGKFRPDDNVTRAEAMAIVNRATNRLPENTSDLLDGMETFVDNSDVNAWYYLNIQEATNSHDFELKADGVHEKWTTLRENPNWAEIER